MSIAGHTIQFHEPGAAGTIAVQQDCLRREVASGRRTCANRYSQELQIIMKNHRVRPIIAHLARQERWIGVGFASCVMLTGCIESEEDLIADSVVTLTTTFVTETGDEGAEDEITEVAPENDGPDAPSFVPFEAIVKFRDPESSGSRASLLALGQLEALTEDTSVVRFEVDPARSGVDAVVETWARIDELRAREDVEFAHPNWLFKLSLIPNDTHYAKQWHYPQVNLPAAWDVTTGSPTVRIAVIDSGRTTHPDLSSKWVSTVEYDAASEDGDARSDSTWNHGVAVAAIAGGASSNGKHSAGVCWGCQILNVDAGSGAGNVLLSAAIRGIRWSVDNGARVINLSFETSLPCSAPITDGKDIPALKEAVAYATAKNVTVVAAAGNAAANASGTSPASCPGVISVAATDQNKTLAAYSNFGQVTLAAPGGAGSLANGKIDPKAQGKALPVSLTGDCGTDPESWFDSSTKGVVTGWTTSTGTHCDRYIAGTSFAAPHVAGVVGLMLSRNPSLTPAQVKQILESTATKPPCNGCGAGLLDANAAVRAVAPLPVNDPKPTASFTVQCSGLQCSFNGGGSSDNSGIVAYEWILPGQQFRLGKVVDAFMPGYGPKSLQLRVTDNRGQSTLINKNFSMSQPSVTPEAGQYHNPDRPGNRLDVYKTSDSGLVVTWYTFDRAGAAVWYTSGAGQRIGARWSQPLYKTTKMNGSVVHTIVGSVSLDFSSSTTAWFSWQLDDPGVFDQVVVGGERFTHLFGGQGRSGAWYRPGDSGWGISVHESGQKLEAAVGIHTPGGAPIWASSSRVTASSNLTLPLTFYQGRGLCPSCGGKSATSGALNYSGSMTLQIADGSVTIGTASITVVGPNYVSIKKPLGPIELVTKP